MDNYTVAFHPRFEEMAAELAELEPEPHPLSMDNAIIPVIITVKNLLFFITFLLRCRAAS